MENEIKIDVDMSESEWKQRFISNIDKIDEKEDLLHDRYYIKENKTVVKLFKGYMNEKDNTFKLLYIESRYGSFNNVLCFYGKLIKRENKVYIKGDLKTIRVDYIREIKPLLPILILMSCIITICSFLFGNFELILAEIFIIVLFFIAIRIEPVLLENITGRKLIKKLRNP
jgi:hypothetical protein